jgi:GNAT superfamily N-acetyltransferase
LRSYLNQLVPERVGFLTYHPRDSASGPFVNVKCFACDALVGAENVDSVVDAFVAHGHQHHGWSYPESAVRNFARNYVEATERLSGDTERLSQIGPISIQRVTDGRIGAWLRLFDHDGFAGNPDWASCYCLEPHLPATHEEPESAWRQRRAEVVERLRAGTTVGYLAYVDDRPAAWVNASSRADYGLFGPIEPDGPEPSSLVGIACFVVAPPFRRHGVASALLDHVIADARPRGASWVEAYPRNEPEANDASHFRGPRSMYDARGFMPVQVREKDTVVRLRVGR